MARGYTLIEMLVVVIIIGILVGGGIASLLTFRERQYLKQAGSQLYSDLRLAQAKASSSETAAGCASGQLQGYGVQITNNSSVYKIVAICADANVDVMQRTLPAGATALTSSKCTTQLSFYILAKGATTGSLCMTYASRYYKVSSVKGGEVTDDGFVVGGTIIP